VVTKALDYWRWGTVVCATLFTVCGTFDALQTATGHFTQCFEQALKTDDGRLDRTARKVVSQADGALSRITVYSYWHDLYFLLSPYAMGREWASHSARANVDVE